MREKNRIRTFHRVIIFMILGLALSATGCATGSKGATGATGSTGTTTDAKGASAGASDLTNDFRGIEPMGNPSDTDWPNPMSK